MTDRITLQAEPALLLAIQELTGAVSALYSSIDNYNRLISRPVPASEKAPLAPAAPGMAVGSNAEAPTPAAADPRQPTAAGSPKPKPKPQHANWQPRWATSARDSVLERSYPRNVAGGYILEEMRKLPGEPLPDWASVQTYAIQTLKLRRPSMVRA